MPRTGPEMRTKGANLPTPALFILNLLPAPSHHEKREEGESQLTDRRRGYSTVLLSPLPPNPSHPGPPNSSLRLASWSNNTTTPLSQGIFIALKSSQLTSSRPGDTLPLSPLPFPFPSLPSCSPRNPTPSKHRVKCFCSADHR